MIIVVLGALSTELIVHKRALSKIPIRIHVNGTRGKSSVTRLIAAGLRTGGMSVLGKTTGSSPRILDLYGKDRHIHRLANASIGEQTRFLRYFSHYRPQAVVLECMAVQPQYQWVSEQRMLHSTHSVITNSRLDHIEEMGPTLEDISQSLGNTIPFKGKIFTAEQENLDILEDIAEKRGTSIKAVTSGDVDADDMHGFNHIEHPENVALALSVCEALGIERDSALEGMKHAQPDPGALRVWELGSEGKVFTFINAFAANDPQSTRQIWKMIKENPGLPHEHICAFLNTRFDRVSRTRHLLDLILKEIDPDRLVVRGERLDRFERDYFRKLGSRVTTHSEQEAPQRVIADLLDQADNTLIFGMGNIVGSGFVLLDELKKYRINA